MTSLYLRLFLDTLAKQISENEAHVPVFHVQIKTCHFYMYKTNYTSSIHEAGDGVKKNILGI